MNTTYSFYISNSASKSQTLFVCFVINTGLTVKYADKHYSTMLNRREHSAGSPQLDLFTQVVDLFTLKLFCFCLGD